MLSNPRTVSLNLESDKLAIAFKLDLLDMLSKRESELSKSFFDNKYPSSIKSLSSFECPDKLTNIPIPKFALVESIAT